MRFLTATLAGVLFCAAAALWAPPEPPPWQSLPFALVDGCTTDTDCGCIDDCLEPADGAGVFPWEV